MDERQRPDLAEVLDHYDARFNISRLGDQSIRCPVHDDKHASASLSLEKGLWHCQACGAGGDSYSLIMAREGCGYEAAVAFGARFSGEGGDGLPGERRDRGGVPEGEGYRPRHPGGYKPMYRRRSYE